MRLLKTAGEVRFDITVLTKILKIFLSFVFDKKQSTVHLFSIQQMKCTLINGA